jgi:diguanylate cyclase (GGDEF)-like protein
VVFVDIDNFKLVNDRYGHSVGDEILVQFADRVRGVAGWRAFVARSGGDDLIVLLDTDLDGGHEFAGRVLDAVHAPFHASCGTITVTAPAGVATAEPDTGVDVLLQRADVAVYSAKQRGRARAVTWSQHEEAWLRDRRRRVRAGDAARVDKRTGALNPDEFDNDIARCGDDDISIVFLDVDFFHEYNERHGHLAGNTTLAAVAQTLRRVVGDQGSVYRFGGEEFTVLVRRSALDVDAVDELGAALREAVEQQAIAHRGSPFGVVTVSVGVAHRRLVAGDVVDAANRAMLAAKAAGRNRCEAAAGDQPQPAT